MRAVEATCLVQLVLERRGKPSHLVVHIVGRHAVVTPLLCQFVWRLHVKSLPVLLGDVIRGSIKSCDCNLERFGASVADLDVAAGRASYAD